MNSDSTQTAQQKNLIQTELKMIPNYNTEILIINTAGSLFAKHGVKYVSMDDIAVNCKISKKTIYKNFETKEMLMHKIVSTTFIESSKGFESLADTEKVFESMDCIFGAVEKIYTVMTPIFITEIKKHYKNVYDLLIQLEVLSLKNTLKKIIQLGKSQGIFTHILDESFSIEIYFNFLHNLINESSTYFCAENQIKFINNYFLYSLLSPNGLQFQTHKFKLEINELNNL